MRIIFGENLHSITVIKTVYQLHLVPGEALSDSCEENYVSGALCEEDLIYQNNSSGSRVFIY